MIFNPNKNLCIARRSVELALSFPLSKERYKAISLYEEYYQDMNSDYIKLYNDSISKVRDKIISLENKL